MSLSIKGSQVWKIKEVQHLSEKMESEWGMNCIAENSNEERILYLCDQELTRAFETDTEMYESQKAAFTKILNWKNVLYIDKTGGGKSAVYFLATKYLRRFKGNGPTLVLSPLLSLMNDQIKNALQFDLKAVAYNSSVCSAGREGIIVDLKKNIFDLVFITPEMLVKGDFLQRFNQFRDGGNDEDTWKQLSLLVLDEAHVVSDWGHDFRPDYYKGIIGLSKLPWYQGVMKLATSATVTKEAEKDICCVMGGVSEIVRGSLVRKNIAIRKIPVASKKQKFKWLSSWLRRIKDQEQNVLIFALTKNDIKEIHTAIKKDHPGLKVAVYHADLRHPERKEIESDFRKGAIKVLISTIALAMGFDKPDIHHVVHWYIPNSPTQYYQEIGRAGRKLSQGRAYVVENGRVWNNMNSIIELLWKVVSYTRDIGDPPNEKDLLHMCRANNRRDADARAAIAVAERRGFISQSESRYRIQFDVTEEDRIELEKLRRRKMEEASFMEKLFTTGEGCYMKNLLEILGEKVEECGKCSSCLKDDSFKDPQVDVNVDDKVAYFIESPKQKVRVYGLGCAGDNAKPNVERFRRILQQCIPGIGIDPPSWTLTFVPRSTSEENEKTWKILARKLHLPSFKYIDLAMDIDISLTQQNNESKRKDAVEKKFIFNEDDLPVQKQVILYDDSYKSGATIDFVSKFLVEKGYDVTAITCIIWNKSCESFDLEYEPPKDKRPGLLGTRMKPTK